MRDPRGTGRALPALDPSVPALLLKLGSYPLHHGGLGVVRSLGRCGVDVYAVTEGGHTPAAVSRYLRGRFTWPTTGHESPDDLLEGLLAIGDAIGRRTVLVPTDDEAAIVVAELADRLTDRFLTPRSAHPSTARSLASKQGLHDLCREHDIPTPHTTSALTRADVESYARHGRFPVVVKNRDAFGRRHHPAVRSSTVVADAGELRALARDWPSTPDVILQEYLPAADAEDWIVHSCSGDPDPSVVFTGVKVRSWPPRAGMTSCASAVWNPELAALAGEFVKATGFAGIADMDWRLDRRDGSYKLLDFNPRVGAQFRLFEDSAGVDVVRAQHLALTGRAVPPGDFPEGRRFVLDDLDLFARIAYRHDPVEAAPNAPVRASATERAWFAPDDPLPVLPLVAGRAAPVLGRLARRVGGRDRAEQDRAGQD